GVVRGILYPGSPTKPAVSAGTHRSPTNPRNVDKVGKRKRSGSLPRGAVAHAQWALRAGLGISALLTMAGLAVLAATYATASAGDRSTYGALWIVGLVLVAIFAAPGATAVAAAPAL